MVYSYMCGRVYIVEFGRICIDHKAKNTDVKGFEQTPPIGRLIITVALWGLVQGLVYHEHSHLCEMILVQCLNKTLSGSSAALNAHGVNRKVRRRLQ
jgi:hypothetical protein